MHQLQGGWLPSWQTTVVVEPGGTTTVVFAGGFGLPLLMQPQSIAEANTSADRIFIFPPRYSMDTRSVRGSRGRRGGAQGAWRHGPNANGCVVDVLQTGQYRFGIGIYPAATRMFCAMSG